MLLGQSLRASSAKTSGLLRQPLRNDVLAVYPVAAAGLHDGKHSRLASVSSSAVPTNSADAPVSILRRGDPRTETGRSNTTRTSIWRGRSAEGDSEGRQRVTTEGSGNQHGAERIAACVGRMMHQRVLGQSAIVLRRPRSDIADRTYGCPRCRDMLSRAPPLCRRHPRMKSASGCRRLSRLAERLRARSRHG